MEALAQQLNILVQQQQLQHQQDQAAQQQQQQTLLQQIQQQNEAMQQQQLTFNQLVQNMTTATGATTHVQQMQQRLNTTDLSGKFITRLLAGVPQFQGKSEGFRDWKFRIENNARDFDVAVVKMLMWAEKETHEIALEPPPAGWDQAWTQFNTSVYNALVQRLDGEAFDIIRNVGEANGAEAWRKICTRYNGKTIGKQLQSIRRCVNPMRIKKLSETTGSIEKWETETRRLDADYNVTLDVRVKTAVLLEMMPPEVTEILIQRVNPNDTYQDVKGMVLRYVEQKQDFDHGPRPMDTSHLSDGSAGKGAPDWSSDHHGCGGWFIHTH